jgi:hypothetical protein
MFTCTLLLSLLHVASVSGVVPLSTVKRISSLSIVPNSFIVEVDALSRIQNKQPTVCLVHVPFNIPKMLQLHELLYASLNKRDIGFKVNKEFNSQGLFVGAALTLNVYLHFFYFGLDLF